MGYTFVQVSSALSQFSSLLSAFGETYERVLAVEQEMLSANRDIQSQTEVVEQLQHWKKKHEVLCHQLFSATHESGTQEISAQASRLRDRRAAIVPTVEAFHQTTQQLSEHIRSLFLAVENVDQNNRQAQKINNVAQVLITNASTLSISASRQQSPEAFEDIRSQFRIKNADLKALAQRLENVQVDQQQNNVYRQDLAAKLHTDLEFFKQVAKTLNEQVESELLPRSQPALATTRSSSTEQTRQLTQQLSTLRASLQEIESLTLTVAQYVSTALNKTRQIHQIRAEVPLTLSPKKQ